MGLGPNNRGCRSGIVLSVWLKVPIVTAWSTPGTALLVTLFPGTSLNDAMGAYITAAIIIFTIGATGSFDWLVRKIPRGIAAGMMAGILFQFGLDAFVAVETTPVLALGMLAAYVIFKRLVPRYCLVLLLITGVALAVIVEGPLWLASAGLSPHRKSLRPGGHSVPRSVSRSCWCWSA